MNRKGTFSKGLSFLIVALLLVTAFTREPLKLWAYAGAFAIFGAWMLAAWLLSFKRHAGTKSVKDQKLRIPKKRAIISPEVEDSLGVVLLRHVNYRVSAYLQSAYPDVTWEWCAKSPEKIAAEGGTGRIRLFGVPDFNYAEVVFDRQARIGCELLQVVPLSAALRGEPDRAPVTPPPAQPVDPAVWYDIQGRGLLESLVADLHSRGHSSLTIKENGDICVKQADSEIVKDCFSNMPDRSCWPGIVKVLEKAGLAASMSDSGILVSW